MRGKGISASKILLCAFCGVMLFVFGVRLACAAEVHMKNGNIFRGEIAVETDSILILDIGAGQLTFQKEDIKEIIREERFPTIPKQSQGSSKAPPSRETTPKTGQTAPKEKTKEQLAKEAEKAKQEAERKAKEEALRKAKEEAEKEQQTWGLQSLDLEKDKIEQYEAGRPEAYDWLPLADALSAIKGGTKPALLYFYFPDDKKSAYYYEKKIFPNPKLSGLDQDFVLAKLNTADEITAADLKRNLAQIGKKTGVAVMGKDLTIGKGASIAGKLPTPEQFDKFIRDAKITFAAAEYKPGSIERFNWVSCDQGFERMKAEKRPGLLYAFAAEPKSDRDKVSAYMLEQIVLCDARFADLNERFVMMKADSSKDNASIPSNARNQIVVILWTFDRAKEWTWGVRTGGVSAEDFARQLDDVSKENEILQYQPGGGGPFSWLELKPGIQKLQSGELPGLLYAYTEKDKKGAYHWEKEVFADPGLKDLPRRFVMVKGDLADVEKIEELKLRRGAKPECVVLLLAPDLKVFQTVTSSTSADRFGPLLDRAEDTQRKNVERAKARR